MQPVATVTTAPTATSGARQARGRRRFLTIAGFVLPALIVYVLFVLYPIAQAVYYSAFDWNGLGPLEDRLSAGLARATESLDSGAGARVLDTWVQVSQDLGA